MSRIGELILRRNDPRPDRESVRLANMRGTRAQSAAVDSDSEPEEFDGMSKAFEEEQLLEQQLPDDPSDEAELTVTTEETRSTGYLILLTIAIGGLQIVWSVELSSISPFLLGLGLSKSLLALVWIAGPLSGTLVQPYVGIRSDNNRSKWGRRRPFIVGGAIATITSLLLLAWTREIIGSIVGVFGGAADSRAASIMRQAFATLLVYVLDFAINVIQAAIRAFIVDCAPTHQQEDANAWANRITGVGNIVGYIAGYVDLPAVLPFLGRTEFQALCTIACLAIASTVAISCLSVQEQDPNAFGPPSSSGNLGVIAFFKSLFQAAKNLAPQVKKVCFVQVWAWIGWFPFLFYITTYVGGIYAEPYFKANPDLSREEVEAIWERGTRAGAFSLFVYAVTSFAASVILPFLIMPTYKAPSDIKKTRRLSAAAGVVTSDTPVDSYRRGGSPTRRLFARIRRSIALVPTSLRIPNLTLRRAWLLSHVSFTVLMWMTFVVHSTTGATVLVGAIGIPWALTNWAPFALIASEISKRDAIRRGLRPPQPSRDGRQITFDNLDSTSAADQAGIVLGIHNVAIAAPQVIATLVSSAMFKALQKPRGQPGDDSVAWVLRFGGICAIGAAWFTRWVEEGDDTDHRTVDRG